MHPLFREILEIILAQRQESGGLVLIPEPEEDEEGIYFDLDEVEPYRISCTKHIPESESVFHLPNEFFPENCAVRYLPSGDFETSARYIISEFHPPWVLILPLFVYYHNTGDGFFEESVYLHLPVPSFLITSEVMKQGSLLAFCTPVQLLAHGLRGELLRENMSQHSTPRWVVSATRPWPESSRCAAITAHLLVVEGGKSTDATLRFFKYPPIANEKEHKKVISDLQRLSQQPAGKTQYGYVLPDGLPLEAPLLYGMYEPETQKREKELAAFSPLRSVFDLAKVLHIGLDVESDLPGGDSEDDEYVVHVDKLDPDGIPILEASNIGPDGALLIRDVRYWADVSNKRKLKAGDICLVDSLRGTGPLRVASVDAKALPLCVADDVLVLRPHRSTTSEDRELLLVYLRSKTAAQLLRAYSIDQNIDREVLYDLSVPGTDEALTVALRGLSEAAQQYESWKAEVEQALSSVFEIGGQLDARAQLLSRGRRLRQRIEAAHQLDDFSYRVRTQFPHPIAYRWRIIETSQPDLDGFMQILEAGEVTSCYLASIAILLARSVDGIEITYLNELATKLSDPHPRGTSMGDWVAILREVNQCRELRQLANLPPFYEISRFLRDSTDKATSADVALARLKKRRDDQAHGRGPKGNKAITEAFTESKADLETLLQAVEFLTDYPLRYVERTQVDSMREITRYDYRELRGDHPLFPIAAGETDILNLEAYSLYLFDRAKKPYLLRPILTWQECPQCTVENWATFYLDIYDRSSNVCTLKAMEHGHTAKDSAIAEPFSKIGLLKLDV